MAGHTRQDTVIDSLILPKWTLDDKRGNLAHRTLSEEEALSGSSALDEITRSGLAGRPPGRGTVQIVIAIAAASGIAIMAITTIICQIVTELRPHFRFICNLSQY